MRKTIQQREFIGPFAEICESYIRKNRALGYKYKINETYLHQFDRYCIGKASPGVPITKDLFGAWTQKRPYESETTHRLRYDVLSRFCMDRHEVDPNTYVGFFPVKRKHSNSDFTPYIFTDGEIGRLLAAADKRRYSKHSPHLQFMLPVILRLLYSCGLRLSEALTLRVRDVDMKNGCILIRDSKFDKSRKLPLSPSMFAVFQGYTEKVASLLDNAEFFFPSPCGGHYAECTIYGHYRKLLFDAGIPHGGRRVGPRLHDLRHTFAVHSLKKLADAGQDLYVTLPILSVYMGHASLATTQLYLRLTPELYPDVTDNFESSFGGVFPNMGVTE